MGALCCVGRGFGCAGRTGPGWAWGLALVGALRCVGPGFGCADARIWLAGLGWAWDLAFCVWSTLYILHVFMMVFGFG